ncbi:MAG: cytochrome c biogenesis protein ResB [Bacteroidales bacterium]|nr:cytochrome c biogenesis protein ResB [Bacteroidales bacterium]
MTLFKKPWKLSDGFLFGGFLVLVGLIVQIALGPVNWGLLGAPINLILLGVFLAFVIAAFFLKKRSGFFAWLGSPAAAVPSIAWTLVMTIVMGLTAQIPSKGWLGNMTSFWPFVLCYIWLTAVVGLVALNHITRLGRSWKEIPAVLNHLGLFVTLVCATLGSVDKRELMMTLHEGDTVSSAETEDGTSYDTGISVRLDDFTMETWPNGMPKRFASDVSVKGKTGKETSAVIEVNKPLKIEGWKMYQYGYDEEAGVEGKMSILQLVKDPWLPLVYLGIFTMIAGAFLMMIVGFRREEVK